MKFSFDGLIVSVERGAFIPPAVSIAEQQAGLNLSSKLKTVPLILWSNLEVKMFRAILKGMSELGIDEIGKRLLLYWKWKIVR
jgi:hypothetical protein